MSEQDDLNSLLHIACNLSRQAGDLVMDIYNNGEFEEFEKEDESPVTSADYAANDLIVDGLKKATPDIPIISEELAHLSLDKRVSWERYWLIDPIDGTQEFIARSGDFSVNIALIENNKPVIGVIYWPAGETLYYASAGHGAYRNNVLGLESMKVRQFNDPEEDPVIVAISRRQPQERVRSRLTDDRDYQTYPLGSCSLKACRIAEGKADLFMRIGPTGEWDTGASQCIVHEAGGKICDVYFNPLSYNQRESMENPNFLVLGDQRVDWQAVVNYKE